MGSLAGPTALLSLQILDRLRNDSLSQVPAAQEALGELERLIGFLDSMGALASGLIELNLSLARGLDYYTGLIYEAVMVKAFDGSDPKVGSIAAGGRWVLCSKSTGVCCGLHSWALPEQAQPVAGPRADMVMTFEESDFTVRYIAADSRWAKLDLKQ